MPGRLSQPGFERRQRPRMAPKAKARCVITSIVIEIISHKTTHSTILVRLLSTAQTGFFYTATRVRQGPSLAAVKYDPRGESTVEFNFIDF